VIAPFRHIARAVEGHRRLVEPALGPPTGASPADVLALERDLGAPLPAAYREYLLWMGRDRDGILRGTNCFVDDVLSNNLALPELLRENGIPPPQARYVTYFMHQGYIACWFPLAADPDDPPVLRFDEGRRASGIEAPGTFSEVLCREIESLATLL
jgi:hypothetical protein